MTTVRSQDKADKIKKALSKYDTSKLDFAIVEDVAQEGAFDKAVQSSPPFEAVIHTASPFHFKPKDIQKDLLDPAVIGTTGILTSIQKHAPSVKKVVITSSFASIVDGTKGTRPGHTYSEEDWNPITHEQALENPSNGYRASKTMAEKAAWDFVKEQKPNFTLSTMCPPLVLGPVVSRHSMTYTRHVLTMQVHHLASLSKLNTSNERIRDIMHGKQKHELSETGTYLWIDVRDIALAHVKAIELDVAANKRYFVTSGYFSNKEIAQIIRKNFPKLADGLPTDDTPGGDYPKDGVYKYDNSRVTKDFGIKWHTLEQSIVDTVKSLEGIEA